MTRPQEGLMDKVGAALSLICLAHCVFIPLLVSSMPFLGAHLFHNELIHLGLLALALPVGLAALGPGYLKHRVRWIPTLGVLGILGLMTAPLAHELGLWAVESFWAFSAALALTTSHLSNWMHCRRICPNSCHQD